MGTAPATRHRYQSSLDKLLVKVPALSHARVGDLAGVDWLLVSEQWTEGAADWNHCARAVSRFLTVFLGDKYHPLRRSVVQQIPRKKETPRAPDQSVESFLHLVAALPLPAQPCFMTMALTGMRIGEYIWADRSSLRPETRSVLVNGKGGAGTVYLTPEAYAIVASAIPCPLGPAPRPGEETHKIKRYGRMRRLWLKAQRECGVSGLTLHDIRHLFGQTAADNNVPTAQTQAALRHADSSMTRRYELPAHARQAAEVVAHRLGIGTPPKKKRA